MNSLAEDPKTLSVMEIDPAIIRLRRERTEMFKRWSEIYGNSNPYLNAALMQQQSASQGLNALLGGLLGGLGAAPENPFTRMP